MDGKKTEGHWEEVDLISFSPLTLWFESRMTEEE